MTVFVIQSKLKLDMNLKLNLLKLYMPQVKYNHVRQNCPRDPRLGWWCVSGFWLSNHFWPILEAQDLIISVAPFYQMAIKFIVDFLLFPSYVVNRFRFHGFRFLPISGFRNRWFINSHRPRIIFGDDEIEKCVSDKNFDWWNITTYAPSSRGKFSPHFP